MRRFEWCCRMLSRAESNTAKEARRVDFKAVEENGKLPILATVWENPTEPRPQVLPRQLSLHSIILEQKDKNYIR